MSTVFRQFQHAGPHENPKKGRELASRVCFLLIFPADCLMPKAQASRPHNISVNLVILSKTLVQPPVTVYTKSSEIVPFYRAGRNGRRVHPP